MSESDPPRFSVVIPAYNEACFLARTLASLQQQDFPGPVEIIVVDNGSTDATADIAASFGVRILYEPRQGVCWARQCGTAAARGEIVVSTDADTTYPPDWLSRMDSALRSDPEAVAVAGPCRFAGGPLWSVIYPQLLFGAVYGAYRLTRRTLYVTATNIAFRRSAWTGYDTALTQGGDELDQLRRLRRRGVVMFDRHNAVSTSARRLQRGFLYNIVVTLFFYYLLGYFLNRLFAREILPTAPHFAAETRRPSRMRLVATATAVLTFLVIAISPHGEFVLDDVSRTVRSWR